ncbi:unnamed protein product [Polarella glacialis]|uniref:Uncharacterized protein n=1 Tax=Polarella glacialis TaxID=89957 RepID=A0A813ID94_POLGL|nr:unnamed protein product [Polarella glacialis]
MLRPGFGQLFFDRDDPLRQAQELLKEQRALAPPKPQQGAGGGPGAPDSPRGGSGERGHEVHFQSPSSVGGASGSNRSPSLSASSYGVTASCEQSAASALSGSGVRGSISPRFSANSSPRTNRRSRRGGGVSARAAADLQLRPSPREVHPVVAAAPPAVDHRRRNVFRLEQLQHQGRWPAEALWAGHPPEFIKERFDRLGTLSTERGDGRTLPHERGEKYFVC